jgi:hypothetical protein
MSAGSSPLITTSIRALPVSGTFLPFSAMTRFVHVYRPTKNLLTIQRVDCIRSFDAVGHFYERKTARLTGISLTYHVHAFHSTILTERELKVFFCHLEREIANENIRHEDFLPSWPGYAAS